MEYIFKENLGTHKVENLDACVEKIREIMRPKYNVDYCDICDVHRIDVDEKRVHVYFKFVHYSTKSMATEPYWLITLTQ